MYMKICSKCCQELPNENFGKNFSSKDGLQYKCKQCRKKEYQNNRILILEKMKTRYHNSPDVRARRTEYNRRRRIDDIENVRNKDKERYIKNKTRILEKIRISKNRNPIKYMLKLAKRRAKKYQVEFRLTENDIRIPEFCPILGIKLDPYNSGFERDFLPTLDRIHDDRGYTPENVIVISHRANRRKSDSSIRELIQMADFYKKFLD